MNKEELRKVKCRKRVNHDENTFYDLFAKTPFEINGHFHKWTAEHICGTNSAKSFAIVEIVETGEVKKFDPEDIKFVEEF